MAWQLSQPVAAIVVTLACTTLVCHHRLWTRERVEQAHRLQVNCFSYTGGFSVAALAGGATEVISVDSSAPALARATAGR